MKKSAPRIESAGEKVGGETDGSIEQQTDTEYSPLEEHDGELERTVPLSSSDSLIGKTLQGKYEIQSRLGAGGMSVVYKALDRSLERTVAVKVLSFRKSDNTNEIMRFKQEAVAISRLEHPNIVKIHAYEIPLDSPPFMVMDYIEGKALSDVIAQEGKLEEKRAINLLIQIARAVEHAHENGVVHRDLKPANILIAKGQDGSEQVKIVDFGIAKLNADGGTAGLNLTQTGEVFGSPLYMSPEQCSGQKPDQRSDIYGLGCVMFEMLSGHPPFEGNTAVQTIQMHLNDEPASLIGKRKDLVQGLALDSIMLKALAKDPARRFQNMNELACAVQPLLAFSGNKQGLEPIAWLRWLNLKRRAGRSKGVPALIAVVSVIVALAAGGTALWHFYDRYQFEENEKQWPVLDQQAQSAFNEGKFEEAEQLFIKAKSSAAASRHRNTRLASSLEGLLDLYVARRNDAKALAVRKELGAIPRENASEKLLSKNLAELKELSSSLKEKREEIKQSGGRQDNPEALGAVYSDLVSRASGILLDNVDPVTYTLRDDETTRVSSRLLKEAADTVESDYAQDHPLTAKCFYNLAVTSQLSRNYGRAKTYFDKLLRIVESEKKIPTLNQVHYLNDIAMFYSRMGEPGKSIPLLKKAIALAGGEDADSKEAFILYYELSVNLYRYGDLRGCRNYARKALSIQETLPKMVAEMELHKARLYYLTGNFEKALAAAADGLSSLEREETKNYSKISLALSILADIYANNGPTMRKAEAMLLRNTAIEKRIGTDFALFQDQIRLAQLYGVMREFPPQVAMYKDAVVTANKLYGEESETMGCFLNDYAYALMQQHDYPAAERTFKRAVSIFEKNKTAPRKFLSGSLYNMAALYDRTGRHAEAKALRLRVREMQPGPK